MKWNNLENLPKWNYQNSMKRWDLWWLDSMTWLESVFLLLAHACMVSCCMWLREKNAESRQACWEIFAYTLRGDRSLKGSIWLTGLLLHVYCMWHDLSFLLLWSKVSELSSERFNACVNMAQTEVVFESYTSVNPSGISFIYWLIIDFSALPTWDNQSNVAFSESNATNGKIIT